MKIWPLLGTGLGKGLWLMVPRSGKQLQLPFAFLVHEDTKLFTFKASGIQGNVFQISIIIASFPISPVKRLRHSDGDRQECLISFVLSILLR